MRLASERGGGEGQVFFSPPLLGSHLDEQKVLPSPLSNPNTPKWLGWGCVGVRGCCHGLLGWPSLSQGVTSDVFLESRSQYGMVLDHYASISQTMQEVRITGMTLHNNDDEG